MVWRILSWHTLDPYQWASFKKTTAYPLLLSAAIPFWPQYARLLSAASSRLTHHVTKLTSFQTAFFNMKMSSPQSNPLHSHQISIILSIFEIWWNGRFPSWMCSWQMCSNYVILLCQCGPKSLSLDCCMNLWRAWKWFYWWEEIKKRAFRGYNTVIYLFIIE